MNGFGIIQELRELPSDDFSHISLAWRVHEFFAEERKRRAFEWMESPEGGLELGKKKYWDTFLYIYDKGVAGYGRTMEKARAMVRRREPRINPAELLIMAEPGPVSF